MSQLNRASQQIATGSEQVALGAQVLSHGTAEQTAAMDELTALTLALSEKIKKNADGARLVHELGRWRRW